MLPSLLLGKDTHRDLANLLKKEGDLTVSGASNETAKALLTSHLLSFHPRKAFVVTQNEESVEGLQHWLKFFEKDAHILHPVQDEEGAIYPEYLQQFLIAMQSAKETAESVFLLSRDTWDREFPSMEELEERKVELKVGQKIDFTKFFESLIERGYTHGDDLYLHPGEYRRIGETLDIFPMQSSHPYRVQLDFEKVDKILSVDADDLSKTEDAGKILEIYPASFSKHMPLRGQFPDGALLILDDQEEIEIPKLIPTLAFTAFPENAEHHIHLRYLSVLKFYTLTDFLNDVRDKLTQNWTLIVVTKRMDELQQIFQEEHVPHTVKSERREGAVTLVHAGDDDLLPHSLQNPDQQFPP
jgi:transcription-repair coupling factor (superfamily II helicase)